MYKLIIAALSAGLLAGGVAIGGGIDTNLAGADIPAGGPASTTDTTDTITTTTETVEQRADRAERGRRDRGQSNGDQGGAPREEGPAGRRDDRREDDATGDVSGPCDEGEHANDPRCTGAPTTGGDEDDRGGDDHRGGNSGHGSDDSGHGGERDDD